MIIDFSGFKKMGEFTGDLISKDTTGGYNMTTTHIILYELKPEKILNDLSVAQVSEYSYSEEFSLDIVLNNTINSNGFIQLKFMSKSEGFIKYLFESICNEKDISYTVFKELYPEIVI